MKNMKTKIGTHSVFAFLFLFLFLLGILTFTVVTLAASTQTKRVTFYAIDGEIERLADRENNTIDFVDPSPFNLTRLTVKTSKVWGTLKQTDDGNRTYITGSVTVFAKGLYSGIGTSRFLDASSNSNVKVNAFARFNKNSANCTSFANDSVVCTTNVSYVYVFIPSHEDLKFFRARPANFTIEISGGKGGNITVHAGNTSTDDTDNILRISDYNITKWKFK
ncbi:MAG TPA: hypothetical protein VJJ76_02180 [archaeon]|nr:hypothetical protein [archaeon]